MAEMFRKRFSNTYELINSELLMPTFMSPFSIMLRYDMLGLNSEIIPYTVLTYVNQLSKASDMGDVNNLVMYTQTIAQLNEANSLNVYMDMPKTITYVKDKMGIPSALVPSESELVEIQEMRAQQAQEQAQQEQMMAQQQAMTQEEAM